MKYLSVCSGIEAATVAWHGLGWSPLAFSEIDAFPSAVLSHHYPSVPNLGDMTKYLDWPEELLAECDMLVGGTPCQAFSVAGQRRSLGDERGNLSLVYVHLFHHINEVRKSHGRPPTIALWENVPGVLSTKDNAFGCFIGGLLGCDDAVETEDGKWPKAGFLGSETVRVGYRILDAQYFAVAQRRRRVFLVAVPCELVASVGERACPSEILSLRESVLGNPPTRGKAGQGSASGFADGSGGGLAKPLGSHALSKGRGTDLDNTTYVAFHPTQDPISSVDGSTHAMGCGSKQVCCTQAVAFQSNLGTRGGDVYEDGTSPAVRVGSGVGIPSPPAVAFKPSHYTRDKDGAPPEVTAPLSADADKGDQDTVVAIPIISDADMADSSAKTPSPDAEGRVRLRDPGVGIGEDGDPMFTMQATKPHSFAYAIDGGNQAASEDVHHSPRTGRDSGDAVATAMAVRRLTPRECERLQGFPDDYTLVTHRGKPAADGPRYRALGNSMAVPCMAWLGWQIHQATRTDNQ
jgi:DNA (cytosine-5)-methyltransferase 1